MSLIFWGGASAGLVQGTIAGQGQLAGSPRAAVGAAAGRGRLAGTCRIDQSLGGALAATTAVMGTLAGLAGSALGRATLVGTMDFPVDPPCCLDAAAVYVTGLGQASVSVPGLRAAVVLG